MLSPAHPQAARVRALLEAGHKRSFAKGSPDSAPNASAWNSSSARSALPWDATNALGGVGDNLQARRTNIDLSYLGRLANTYLFQDDTQIRDVRYREEPGELGYRLGFWTLDADESDDRSVIAEIGT